MENEALQLEHNVGSLMVDLQMVLKELEECTTLTRNFLSVSAEWECCRKDTIKMLEDIALELDKHHHNINIAKITGCIVSIIGVIAALVGANGNSNLLRYLLSGSAMVGGLTTAGSSLVEVGLTSNLLSKAQTLLAKDNQISENLCVWFKRSNNLVEEIEKICDFNVLNDVFTRCYSTLLEISDCTDGFFEVIQNIIIEVLTKRAASKNDIGKICVMIKIIYHNQDLLKIAKKIFNILRSNPHTLEAVQLAVGFRWIISNGLSATGDIVQILISLFGKKAAEETVRNAMAYGVFGALKLALDVLALTLTSTDIHKGSVSEYGNMIRKVNTLLENELNCVKQLQEKLGE